jgi:hypothetical protein
MGVGTATEMHALLVTTDSSLVTTFTDVLRDFNIAAETSLPQEGIPAELVTRSTKPWYLTSILSQKRNPF